MTLLKILSTIQPFRTDEIVVTTMGPVRDWGHVSAHPLDFHFLPSSMGQAAPIAHGLALAQPDRQVWVFDGDGSLLMNLGVLATIGHTAPRNLTHFVVNNGVYQTTGGQPTPAPSIDFPALALGALWPSAERWGTEEEIRKGMSRVLQGEKPMLVELVTEVGPDEPAAQPPGPLPEHVRAFRDQLIAES